ncbi:MAG: hypothetical protein LBS69_08650, partial [Prevotellaceae bacterium]|nr:hypothetical protein [Prevotellaceae bacterium]
MKLLNILLQAEVSQGGSGMTSTLILVILMILIGVIVFFIVNKQKKINELETQLAKKNSKINQLEEQLAEKENDKVFKIKDD